MALLALVLAVSGRQPTESLAAAAVPAERPEVADVAGRLPGTWLREQAEQGVRSRRLLDLAADGTFRERVRIVSRDGEVSQQEHAGNWFYDGTNLKRKYTVMDGRPPSRLNLPFATFEIRFESRDEFVGTNHVYRSTVRYERVAPETPL